MASGQDKPATANRGYPMSRIVRLGIVAAFAVVSLGSALASPAQTQPHNFDGHWSVVIMTQKGDCDRAYRYPIAINSGTLANAGDAAFDISGKVRGDGSIMVRLSYGDKSANGSGRLSADSGSGSWSGGSCAGTWTAEKRG